MANLSFLSIAFQYNMGLEIIAIFSGLHYGQGPQHGLAYPGE